MLGGVLTLMIVVMLPIGMLRVLFEVRARRRRDWQPPPQLPHAIVHWLLIVAAAGLLYLLVGPNPMEGFG